MFQSTLEAAASFTGIGVHKGNNSSISVVPTNEDVGIVFANKGCFIVSAFDNVSETTMCTKLSGAHGISISTIEHISAALYGLGITNAIIKTNDDEIPILDGSAIQFVESFLSVGIRTQMKKRKILKVVKTIKVYDGEKWSSLSESDSFNINIECDFTHKGLETKQFSFDFLKDDFVKEIAPARTFGFFSDLEFLRKNNLASGASLDNAMVFDNNANLINKTGFRLENEPMRHKILDIIGDLSLVGCKIVARFDSFCPSHKMNNAILHALFSQKDNYELID